MQHINSVLEDSHVNHPVGSRSVTNANLPDALPDAYHRLPIVGIKAALNALQLKPRIPARSFREGPKPGERVAGFIYIGTASNELEERPRPDMEKIVTVF